MDWVLELNVLGRGSISLRRERAIIVIQSGVQLVFMLDKRWIQAALVVLVRVNLLM